MRTNIPEQSEKSDMKKAIGITELSDEQLAMMAGGTLFSALASAAAAALDGIFMAVSTAAQKVG